MKVILRPIGWNKWSGIIKYKNCFEDLGSYYTRSGSLYTGLSKEDEVRLGEKLGLDLAQGSEYWKNFFIRTSVSDIILDTDDPMDELKYIITNRIEKIHKINSKLTMLINEKNQNIIQEQIIFENPLIQ